MGVRTHGDGTSDDSYVHAVLYSHLRGQGAFPFQDPWSECLGRWIQWHASCLGQLPAADPKAAPLLLAPITFQGRSGISIFPAYIFGKNMSLDDSRIHVWDPATPFWSTGTHGYLYRHGSPFNGFELFGNSLGL